MKKLLIIIACLASLSLAGCSDRLRIVHKIDVQQGNVVTQDMVDQLQPGMSRNQVQYIMGSPIVVDVFHQERWDYLYWLQIPGDEPVLKTLTLHFDNGYLDRITGDYEPEESINEEEKRVVVDVPDYRGKGLFRRALDTVGLDGN
jgi:outer membrane protein assembly factor BamE